MSFIVRRAALLAAIAWSVLLAPSARAEDAPNGSFFFKDGDRVVMIGDSITEQHLYSNYVEMWTVTRFPTWDLTFRNVGIGGDRSPGGNGRFKRDVLAYKPTAITADFGMNDGGYRPFDEAAFAAYMKGLAGMAEQARAAGIRAAWVTPQPLDAGDAGPTALTGYNQTLERFSEGVKATAEKDGGVFVDQFHPYLAALDRARKDKTPYERITGGDAVHPGFAGQALMAASILKGLNFPALVSSAELTLESPSAGEIKVTSERCQISPPTREGDGLKFERTDEALPFFPAEARPILAWAPILEELNRYTLKVAGLKPGRYAVKLGGETAAEFDAEELARGVNLADAALKVGPVAAQVKEIKAAIEAKNKYHHDRIFRGVVLAQAVVPDWLGLNIGGAEIEARRKAAVEERMAKMPELDEAVRRSSKPRPHTVEVVPLGN
jgi:lysophospholipase L1-like esterase